MDYLNKIKKFFNVEKVSDDTMKIERNGFEIFVITINNKLVCKIGKFNSYETLYRSLLKKYNEYVADEIVEKLKDICPDCGVSYKRGIIKIKYYDSHISMNKYSIKTFIRKEHFEIFLDIQNKLFETGLLYL